MKMRIALFGVLCTLAAAGVAQVADPVVMRINGVDVPRSEFEYNYNKNNGENVAEHHDVDDYVDLFVNYKLKVQAALDARYDTLASFRKEFATYRDQQIRPYFVSPAMVEQELLDNYNRMKEGIGPDGLVMPAHIMMVVSQQATPEQDAEARRRIDSIATAIQGGADFETMAKQHSQDRGTASRGGVLGWISRGQTLKEFEDAAFALSPGQVSQVVRTPMGYHLIQLKERKQLDPYEQLKPQLQSFLEQRGLKDRIAAQVIDSIAKASGGTLTSEQVMERKTAELCAADSELKYLIQEYHDGLLLYEICSKEVWEKAATDQEGLAAYFKANKKKYKWDAPRFRGVVCHSKDEALQAQVKRLLKGLPQQQWVDTLRATFNRDSLTQIRVEKNIFKPSDNKFVDHLVFGVKEAPKPLQKYPCTQVYGKKLKKPEVWTDVRGEVISDYQGACEAEFVRKLRERYQVEVYPEVLATVNKH